MTHPFPTRRSSALAILGPPLAGVAGGQHRDPAQRAELAAAEPFLRPAGYHRFIAQGLSPDSSPSPCPGQGIPYRAALDKAARARLPPDRKSTRLNSSH